MPAPSREDRKQKSRYRRARVRKFLFTVGPDRLSGGRMRRRHLAQDVEVREVEIASPLWPDAFDGLRIGHVSDFHLGDLLPVDRAVQIVDQVGDLGPDLVACTGDVVDLHHHDAPALLDALARVGAPLGSALVLGNHDELHCADALSRMAIDAGVQLLRNEAIEINHRGDHLIIAGIDWAKTTPRLGQYVDLACGGFAHLLLAHNPKAFVRAAELGIPLTLAGHTHGGQVALKNRPGVNLAATQRFSAGLFECGGSHLYVTAGVGAWFPLRMNCPAEIVMITMRCGTETASNGAVRARRVTKRRSRGDDA